MVDNFINGSVEPKGDVYLVTGSHGHIGSYIVEELVKQSLNETEIAQLDGVLSPSNAAIFKKIAPEASTVIDQFTSEEEVVSLPVSTIVNYAMKIYGGDQQIAVQKFITELSGEQSDNTNVPLDTAQAPTEEGMLAQQSDTSEIDAIDQDLV